jgi:hypothetical protein
VVLHLGLAHYGLTQRFDHLLHFLGGASIAYFLFGFLDALPSVCARIPGWIKHLLVFTSACTVALFWEFAEFASDWFLGTTVQRSLSETMLDLAYGVAGASSTLLVVAAYRFLGAGAKKAQPAAGAADPI